LYYLDSLSLFEPAFSSAKQFNNTCQLLKCLGFVLQADRCYQNNLSIAESHAIPTKGRNGLGMEDEKSFNQRGHTNNSFSQKSRDKWLFGFCIDPFFWLQASDIL
jgi:hypothetical protein